MIIMKMMMNLTIIPNYFFVESAKANEERFKKMKDIYGKLREEHVKLLRTVSPPVILHFFD